MSSANIGGRSEEQPERETGESGRSDPAAVGPAQEAGGRRTRNVLHVLGNREFALFWSGQSISQTGTWMQQFAQGWVVTTLGWSALALASVNFAASIPMLILMPFGGVAADRIEASDPASYAVRYCCARCVAGCADPDTSPPPLAHLGHSAPARPHHCL
jgi:hypothetical protein